MRSMMLYLMVMLCLVCCRSVLAQVPQAPLTIESPFLRVLVNNGASANEELGRFAIATTGGDPEQLRGQNKPLISGGKKLWSSYTTLQLDTVNYLVGGPSKNRAGKGLPTGVTLTGPAVTGNQIDYREKIGDVEVSQQLSLLRGAYTRMLDTVGITYTLTNRGTVNHDVGMRVMLNVVCGDNNSALMLLHTNALTAPIMLPDADNTIPDTWQAQDSLINPSVIFTGILRDNAATPPDQMIFADWGTLADDSWLPALNPKQAFMRKGEKVSDPAMAMYWKPVTLAPGKTITIVSYGALGYSTLKHGQLKLELSPLPEKITYQYANILPVTFTWGVQNVGGFDAHNLAMKLTVPEGLDVVEGSSPVAMTMQQLKPDEMLQGNWSLVPNGKAGGQKTLMLSVTSNDFETLQVEKVITVVVPKECAVITPANKRVLLAPHATQTLFPEVKLLCAQEFSGIKFTVKFDPKVIILRDLLGNIPSDKAEIDHKISWTANLKDIDNGVVTFTGKRIEEHAGKNADQNEVAPFPTGADMTLYSLTFRTVNPGATALTFTNFELINKAGEKRALNVTSDVKNAEIEVVASDAPATPTP